MRRTIEERVNAQEPFFRRKNQEVNYHVWFGSLRSNKSSRLGSAKMRTPRGTRMATLNWLTHKRRRQAGTPTWKRTTGDLQYNKVFDARVNAGRARREKLSKKGIDPWAPLRAISANSWGKLRQLFIHAPTDVIRRTGSIDRTGLEAYRY